MRKREATKAHFQERMRSAPPRIENSARGLRSKMQWAKRIQLRIDDRDRIHDAFRIQRGLASPHRGDECRITVLRQLRGVRPADAVFRRERTVAFAHQSEDGLPYLSPAGWRKHVVMQVPVADIVSAKVKFASFALSRLVRFRRSEGFNPGLHGSAWAGSRGGCRRPARRRPSPASRPTVWTRRLKRRGMTRPAPARGRSRSRTACSRPSRRWFCPTGRSGSARPARRFLPDGKLSSSSTCSMPSNMRTPL